VWIDILAGRIKPEDCALSQTDSSTSEGWAYKTNFDTGPFEQIVTSIPKNQLSNLTSAESLPTSASKMRSVITANGSLEKKTMSQMLYQEI
jgi:hypothetical protein